MSQDLEQSGTILALREQSKEIRLLHTALFFCGSIGAAFFLAAMWLVWYVIKYDVVGNILRGIAQC